MLILFSEDLLRNYLQKVNYTYYSIHPPTFLQEYTDWVSNVAVGRKVSAAYTCLLLQICSNSAQTPTQELRKKLQCTLGENARAISKRLHDAAAKLGEIITPGTGGVHRTLQLALAASWLKGEGLIIEGWHCLSRAVREAQECGELNFWPRFAIAAELTPQACTMRRRTRRSPR